MDYCVAQWLDFTITADLDVSARAVIAQIPQKDWRLVVKDGEIFLFAEIVYAQGVTNQRNSFQLSAW